MLRLVLLLLTGELAIMLLRPLLSLLPSITRVTSRPRNRESFARVCFFVRERIN